jgi:hypothetical protein
VVRAFTHVDFKSAHVDFNFTCVDLLSTRVDFDFSRYGTLPSHANCLFFNKLMILTHTKTKTPPISYQKKRAAVNGRPL